MFWKILLYGFGCVLAALLSGIGYISFEGLFDFFSMCGLSEKTTDILSTAIPSVVFACIGAAFSIKDVLWTKEKEFTQKSQEITRLQSEKEKEIAKSKADFQSLEKVLRSGLDHFASTIDQQADELKLKENKLESEKEEFNEMKEDFDNMLLTMPQSNPWLARQIADFRFMYDNQTASMLRNKARPAFSAAKQVQEIAMEKRELQVKLKTSEYQLNFYESMFPWLLDFKEIPAQEAVRYIKSTESDYDALRQWLSPEEYANLSSAEKNQRALDRYLARNKSNWEAGIDYERYIGYLFESQGKTVSYVGATMGLEDRGIDIIAKDRKETVVIQCKRYSSVKNKYVHENTVAQLYGVAAVYKMENPKIEVIPMIYTSSALSDEAKHFAEYLNIEVRENVELEPYPMIKCNISKDGEKIYHLPFDQQYDRVSIANKKGARYASTVAEAEEQGFRRAYKWKPKAENSASD